MRKIKFNVKAIQKACIKKTDEIIIGNVYFLSVASDDWGCYVRALYKSTKENKCGWPSTVTIEILETVNLPKHLLPCYPVGIQTIVNATNLYTRKEDTSPEVKYNLK